MGFLPEYNFNPDHYTGQELIEKTKGNLFLIPGFYNEVAENLGRELLMIARGTANFLNGMGAKQVTGFKAGNVTRLTEDGQIIKTTPITANEQSWDHAEYGAIHYAHSNILKQPGRVLLNGIRDAIIEQIIYNANDDILQGKNGILTLATQENTLSGDLTADNITELIYQVVDTDLLIGDRTTTLQLPKLNAHSAQIASLYPVTFVDNGRFDRKVSGVNYHEVRGFGDNNDLTFDKNQLIAIGKGVLQYDADSFLLETALSDSAGITTDDGMISTFERNGIALRVVMAFDYLVPDAKKIAVLKPETSEP